MKVEEEDKRTKKQKDTGCTLQRRVSTFAIKLHKVPDGASTRRNKSMARSKVKHTSEHLSVKRIIAALQLREMTRNSV